MYKQSYTAEQLADAFLDLREIENVMGRYVRALQMKQEDSIVHEFFSRFEDDICYGDNNGWYTGRRAVEEYYAARYALTEERSRLVRELFPEYLGGRSDEEIHGVGEMQVDAINPPCLEISGYGTTAKGVWLFNNTSHEIYANGPYTMQENGYYAVDFAKEGTAWKIWHMQRIVEMRSPQNANWADKWELPAPLPQFEALKEQKLPAYTKPGVSREIYYKGRPEQPKLRLPEPYYDWPDTFSYGPHMPEYKRAGMFG